jgi:outer membrane protein OmpA-like peptidoglycan-associated protein
LTPLASRAAGAGGAKGNGGSFALALSGDGRFVAFTSTATNLHPDDTDANFDVFRRDVLGPPPAPPPPAPPPPPPAPPPPPPAPPPPPTPPPAPPPRSPAPAVLRLQVLRLSVFGRSEARCRMRVGRIHSCRVRLLAGGRVVAQGSRRARGARSRSLLVTLRLTGRGRTLLAKRLGGIRTRVRASAATSGGARRASARTMALLRVERFTTPPGSFEPDQAALTARGERFLRSLRERLIAVASLRCEGHSADVHGTLDTTSPLSLARAAATCQALRRLGVRAQPRLAGHGDSDPIASNANESGRAENRRVEVTVTHRPRRL